jgi:F-type H+-transporting ATPase subunit gamma
MSRRREIEEHIRAISEIRGIMSAMKNLALTETQKLTRAFSAQQRVVHNLEAAASDLLRFYPELSLEVSGTNVYLVIGSERGFCGDYNGALLSALDRHCQAVGERDPFVVIVGRKLSARVAGERRAVVALDGPSVAEEVQPALTQLMDRLKELQHQRQLHQGLVLTVVYHEAGRDEIIIRPLQPGRPSMEAPPPFTYPPFLNLTPAAFLTDWIDLYLLALLHEVFYSALMAENRARLQHLQGALERIDRDTEEMRLRRNMLRQEEITEEIEVIMLSAEGKRVVLKRERSR